MSEHEVAVSVDNLEIKYVRDIDTHLKWLMWNWNSSETSSFTPDDRQWWQFWKTDASQKNSLLVAGRYILEGVDDFVRIAYAKGNPLDHKATILYTTGMLYDTVIHDVKIPWWMRPFKSSLKELIINVVISLLVDYITKHYQQLITCMVPARKA